MAEFYDDLGVAILRVGWIWDFQWDSSLLVLHISIIVLQSSSIKKEDIPIRFLTSSLVSSYGFTTNGIKKDFLFIVIYTAHLYYTIILHSSTIKKEDIPIKFLVSSFVSFYGFATNCIKERFFFIIADLFRNCLDCQSYFVFLFTGFPNFTIIFYWLRDRLWRGRITNLKKNVLNMDD